MATWDDSESDASESYSEEEHANVEFMATTFGSSSERESDPKEVFYDLSRSDLESCLSESLSSYQKLRQKFKALKKVLEGTVEECDKHEMEVSELKREAAERLQDRLAREAEENARREAEEKAHLEEEEERARESVDKASAEATAAAKTEAKTKADPEEAAHFVAEEATKARDAALTQGEKSCEDMTS
ncbi:eukaryotic translation initiation factor 4 gamma-like [Lathyrus oleraceus]|uniref:eukaryotic translation initiation factor 4 gamma-like n=1 Tax=Pisum sativum TaxID=3888 RepID=UPI0021CF2948|nr:eukaryotic translation initiation factor 4 gamma-like [Pisum sativum]